MRHFYKLIGIFLMITLTSACTKLETSTFKIENIALKAEGPLFEGPNTAQGEINKQLEGYAKSLNITVENIESAKLKSVTIKTIDSGNFDLFSSIKIQLVSEKTDMMDIGVINPIPAGSKEVKLSIAGELSDLIELLKQEKITIVADAGLTKDIDMNINWNCDLEFEINYTK